MILSHRHKFIFIKTHKTAGTSLEIALSKFCGPNDIITPIIKEDEILRRSLGYRTAQNYDFPISPWSIRRRISTGEWPKKFQTHTSAPEARRLIGEDLWNSYFKFTIVRNPIDRALSRFFWEKNYRNNMSNFDEFLRTFGHRLSENKRIVCEGDSFLLDGFVKYELLSEDLKRIEKIIGLPEDLYSVFAKIKAKGAYRPKNEKPVISEEQLYVLKYLVRPEADVFSYELGGSTSYVELDPSD